MFILVIFVRLFSFRSNFNFIWIGYIYLDLLNFYITYIIYVFNLKSIDNKYIIFKK